MIRVCIAGVTGWTGRAVADAVGAADDMERRGVARSGGAFPSVAGRLDAVETDVLVDYTHADVGEGERPRGARGAACTSSSDRAG